MQVRVLSSDFSKLIWGVVSATILALLLFCLGPVLAHAQTATDPGIRTGALGAGGFVSGLNNYQQEMTSPATNFMEEVNIVAGGPNVKRVGLGATFDSNSCNSCHAQVGVGGGSPAPCGIKGSLFPTCGNQLLSVYNLMGATNVLPFFETQSGPSLVARAPYQPDLVTPAGGVQRLFTITGRTDAGTCNIPQPDFEMLSAENNLIFRNTPPFFGEGLMEIINDSDIIANMNANLALKMSLGISGNANIDPDDGSVDRIGWKAQHRSLLAFIAEAYDVEEGIDNEFFPNKTNETPGCTPPFPLGPPNGNGTHGVPDDRTDWAVLPATGYLMPGDVERFAIFGRLLAPPAPGACPYSNPSSCSNGQTYFASIGCVLCHTNAIPGTTYTGFTTPPSSIAALGNQPVNLYSDLLVHHMGVCLADNVTQGSAAGDEFKTPPLWGVGQRYFFLHDARTTDIVTAIQEHADGYQQDNGIPGCTGNPNAQYPPSEADAVIAAFNNLSTVAGVDGTAQQDLINFLRSL
ncbi:MAG TPA: di-heme oxidoredictase family protein [Terriglobia bacterium]|nr:di-heme oxidoredictase family protein [Terriglobia bacterium]